MNYPITKGQQPKGWVHHCTFCGKPKAADPYLFASLDGGAILTENGALGHSVPSDRMDGFLYLAFHREDPTKIKDDKARHIFEVVSVAQHVTGGQFSLSFCSISCLRAFLNKCVDDLEDKAQEATKALEPPNVI